MNGSDSAGDGDDGGGDKPITKEDSFSTPFPFSLSLSLYKLIPLVISQ